MFDPGKHKVPIKEFRSLIITIDSFIYFILNLIFKVFFNIVNANFLDNDIIETFYSNIELLIGLFITFRLSFSLINYLINPDSFSDSKVGAGKMIIKIITALCMLTMIIPLSGIPDNNAPNGSYNQAIKQKGIAFGTLQFVQDRILSQNIIGKLVLGIRGSNSVSSSYKQQANTIVAGILKGFIYPAKKSDGSYYCNKEEAFENYQKHNSYHQILHYADGQYCDDGDKYYAFSYVWLGSWICGAIFIVIVAGFCVDVAIRLIKLTILRLIAPIPIISYINPNSEKSGAFSSWVKMVTSTYLDLFLRIGLIYLVVYICSTLIGTDSVVFQSDSGVLNTISKIFIWIGLFMFAKQAPKFLKDVLGIKSDNKGFFSGVGTVAGLGAAMGGITGSFLANKRASYLADDINKKGHGFGNRMKNFGAGIVGGITGFASGASAALGAKDHSMKAARNAIYQRNMNALARGASGSTFAGRMKNSATAMISGDTDVDKLIREETMLNSQLEQRQHELAVAKAKQNIAKSMMDYGKEQAAKTGKGAIGHFNNKGANLSMELDRWNASVNAAKAAGLQEFDVEDINGNKVKVSMVDALRAQSKMEETAAGYWLKKNSSDDKGIGTRLNEMSKLDLSYDFNKDSDALYADIKKTYIDGFGDISSIQTTSDNSIENIQESLRNNKQEMARAKANNPYNNK